MFRPRVRAFALMILAMAAAVPGAATAQTTAEATPWGRATQIVIPQTRCFPVEHERPGVHIEAVSARVRLQDGVASTTLDIKLRNTSHAQEEAVLLLPVPDDAAVGRFEFDGASSEPTAQLLRREEARRTYDAIVRKLRDPALMEFAGYNLIRTSVFPVPPNGTQRVRLTYEHVLGGDGHRLDYVLPRSESLERRRPWRIEAEVVSEHAISTVYSPSHAIIAERTSPTSFSVRLTESAASVPGAFRLSYLLDRGDLSASVFTYPDPGVGGGFFLLMAGLPARDASAPPTIRREVTVVIDRSGSMAGSKMDQVRAAAGQVIEGLADGEAFNILDYSSTVSAFAERPVIKSRETIALARTYLDGIRPTGGTNIHDALLEALRQPPTEGMLSIVLFLTDGLPTIGKTSEVAIRTMVESGNAHQRRVFTFGVGEDVNAPLLDRIAAGSRATAAYVLPDEDVELAVARVFRRLSGPIFASPRLRALDDLGAPAPRLVHELIPNELPDLFDGDQLVLLGQYRGDEPVTLELSGNFEGEDRSYRYTFTPASATTRNAFVPRLWASRRIAFLIDAIRQAGAASGDRPVVVGETIVNEPRYQELIDEIVRLSTTYGILTEYTAFLATEGTDLSDWDDLVVGCSTNLERRAVRTRSGRAALNQAMNYKAQWEQTSLNYDNRFIDENLESVAIANVQQVSDRAFFRRGARWIDARLIDTADDVTPDVECAIGSAEHFDVLYRLADQGRQGVLALDGEILLDVDGQVVLVRGNDNDEHALPEGDKR